MHIKIAIFLCNLTGAFEDRPHSSTLGYLSDNEDGVIVDVFPADSLDDDCDYDNGDDDHGGDDD
jgi:hypothetical protein